MGDISAARQKVDDNIGKYQVNLRIDPTEDGRSDSFKHDLKEQVTWINAYLSTVYDSEMRLSTLLSKVGFDSNQVQIIRDGNLEHLVNSYITTVKKRFLDYKDGERLFMIMSRRLELDGKVSETLQSLGDRLGISRERVRQLELKVIRKCRHPVNKSFLESNLSELAQRALNQN